MLLHFNSHGIIEVSKSNRRFFFERLAIYKNQILFTIGVFSVQLILYFLHKNFSSHVKHEPQRVIDQKNNVKQISSDSISCSSEVKNEQQGIIDQKMRISLTFSEVKLSEKKTVFVDEMKKQSEISSISSKKLLQDLLNFEDIFDISDSIPLELYQGIFNMYYDTYDRTSSFIYKIIQDNNVNLVDEFLSKKNAHDIIALFYNDDFNFVLDVKDMRILGLLYYKINFTDVFGEKYKQFDIRKRQFLNYFQKFILNNDFKFIEQQFSKAPLEYLEKNDISRNFDPYFFSDFFNKIYSNIEKRIENNKNSTDEYPFYYDFIVKNLCFADYSSLLLFAQNDTKMASSILAYVGKNYQLFPYISEGPLILSKKIKKS